MLAALCASQGIGTIAVDMNRTHAANPGWTGHARFHVVWQIATTALLAAFEVVLLYSPLVPANVGFYLAALLASLPMLSFFAAVLSRRIFGATLSDPNGIPPLALRMGTRQLHLDMNVIVEAVALVVLTAITLLYKLSPR